MSATNDGPAGGYDVVVAEDIQGEPLTELARQVPVLTAPDLWDDRPRLLAQLGTASALVVRNRTQVDKELLAAAPALRIIARAGVGLDNIDVEAAHERGVVVASPRGANARSVAEHTLGAALALARGLVSHDRAVRAGQWQRGPGRELAGRTWGLLGAGATGTAVAALAHALGMHVCAYDPYVDPNRSELREFDARFDTLERVCADADVLSVHLPATPRTHRLLDARLLSLLRPDALLINVGRGEVIDEDALADALEAGKLGGAALDVRAQEPPVVGRLEQLPNVVLTPHVAGITTESQARIVQALVDDIRAVLAGQPAAHAVNDVRTTA